MVDVRWLAIAMHACYGRHLGQTHIHTPPVIRQNCFHSGMTPDLMDE